MNSNSNNNICGIHNKSLKFICYDCNVLMCSVCSPKHSGHSYDHINNIKSNINIHNNEDSTSFASNNQLNNNNAIGMKDIQRSIQTTFDSLKSKVVEYEQLQQTEQEIESKFKELHEFLVVEEHRLKKPIIDNKQQLEQQIDKQIKIMKSLNTFIVNNEPFNQIKNQIQSSFKLQNVISIQNKQSYIFSTDNKNKLSIINITDRNNIHFEQQGIDMICSCSAFNSITKVGDFIYMFGGHTTGYNKFIKYSINTKTLVSGDMKDITPSSYLSACYDGQDHIYIFDGYFKPKTDIYRYNINNSTFERYSTIEFNTDYHHLTFLFKGYIYTFTSTKKVLKFDIQNKTTVELSIPSAYNTSASVACTDGNGNIYLLSSLGLQRINIETNEIKSYDNSKINTNPDYNLIYHQSDGGQSYIYSIQGKNRNFMFSFENNKWESILQNDQSDRMFCANILYQQ
ncbi:hypothetical protein PPL_07517 [Heterostelium album PN500]|uniref:B box-type domain-containing protein n=1 Tax=Heterostelium pallidum (strain ATCC 26659 / Pp 5 / PN500) TaxID=670386 RepID=D3BG66_HETP5|nr:hypothetical protein PPL_07517 [Heterostelium album PN500]EFA79658.1 hypothetical protein PPL_07517 [Heterostelium album PN500]|eukprot:XP_020431779.1 hypothetical protein PPL_07517 [Heterostelium album PN500]